jgi:hypothetical protein
LSETLESLNPVTNNNNNNNNNTNKHFSRTHRPQPNQYAYARSHYLEFHPYYNSKSFQVIALSVVQMMILSILKRVRMILLRRFEEACCLYLQGDRVTLKYILRHPPMPNQVMVLFGPYNMTVTLKTKTAVSSEIVKKKIIFLQDVTNKSNQSVINLAIYLQQSSSELEHFCEVISHVGQLVRTG